MNKKDVRAESKQKTTARQDFKNWFKNFRSAFHIKNRGMLYALMLGIYTAIVLLMGIASAIQVPLFKIGNTPVGIVWAAPLAGLAMLVAGLMAEVFGKKKTIFAVSFGYAMSIVFTLWLTFGQLLFGNKPENNLYFGPNAHFFPFDALGTNWRFFIAGFLAYTFSTIANVTLVWKFKKKNHDKKISGRLMIASIVGQFIDNSTFAILAFAPIGLTFGIEKSWLGIVYWFIANTVLELTLEVLLLPLIRKFVIKKLQKHNLYEELDGSIKNHNLETNGQK